MHVLVDHTEKVCLSYHDCKLDCLREMEITVSEFDFDGDLALIETDKKETDMVDRDAEAQYLFALDLPPDDEAELAEWNYVHGIEEDENE